VKRVKYIDRDELKSLWRVLERLQAQVQPGGAYVWEDSERKALVTVMDAAIDTYHTSGGPSLEERWKAANGKGEKPAQ